MALFMRSPTAPSHDGPAETGSTARWVDFEPSTDTAFARSSAAYLQGLGYSRSEVCQILITELELDGQEAAEIVDLRDGGVVSR